MAALLKTGLQLLNVVCQGRPLRRHLTAQLVTLNRPAGTAPLERGWG
jgi:hypothetical protein